MSDSSPYTVLHKSFWHGDPDALQSYRYYRHAYLWTQYVGRFKVQTWTDRDGKPIATGWFTKGV